MVEIREDKKIKYLCTLINQKASEIDNEKIYIGLENVEPKTSRLLINEEASIEIDGQCNLFFNNNVLFGKLRPYLAKGFTAEFDGRCSGEFLVLQTSDKVLPSFLNYLMLSDLFIDDVNSSTYGAKMPRASWDYIGNKKVLVPTIEVQKSIVEFLNEKTYKINLSISKKQKLIELLQEKRQAIIDEAITKGLDPNVPMKDSGIEWLGNVPAHWNVLRLKFLCESIISGPFGSALTKDMYVSRGNYRVYGQEQVIPNDFSIGDYYISDEKFNEMKRYAVEPQDILISCVGTFGKIAIVPNNIQPGIINPRLIKLKLKGINPNFFGLMLKSNFIFSQLQMTSRGGTMDIINVGILSELICPIPSRKEQNAIADWITIKTLDLDQLIEQIKLQIEKLQEYRQSLISEAVTGKNDVREYGKENNNDHRLS